MKTKKGVHFSRILFVVVVFSVTIAALGLPSQAAETTATGVLNATRVNIRQGPGLNHQVVGIIITKGTEMMVLGRSGDWVRIYYNGLTGFIYSPFVDIKEEKTTPEIETRAPVKTPPPIEEPPPPAETPPPPIEKPPLPVEAPPPPAEVPPPPSDQTGLIKDYRLQNHLAGYEKSLTGYHRALKKAIHLVFLFLESIEKRKDLTTEEKKQKAIEFIRQVRWGPENKHYFWINDLDGKMLLEPLYPYLEGKICKIFKDIYSKEIFVDFIKTGLKYKEGFVDHHGLGYDNNKSNPRISIVRLFDAWGWIIGTGLELDAAKPWEEPEVELHFLLPPLDKEFSDEAPASGI